MSLRAQIEAASKREPATVHVKEWGCDVLVQHLTVGELHKAFERREAADDLGHCVFVAACCTDADGVHLWDVDSDDDLRALDALGAPVITLEAKVHEVNGLTSDEDTLGNSQDRGDG